MQRLIFRPLATRHTRFFISIAAATFFSPPASPFDCSDQVINMRSWPRVNVYSTSISGIKVVHRGKKILALVVLIIRGMRLISIRASLHRSSPDRCCGRPIRGGRDAVVASLNGNTYEMHNWKSALANRRPDQLTLNRSVRPSIGPLPLLNELNPSPADRSPAMGQWTLHRRTVNSSSLVGRANIFAN